MFKKGQAALEFLTTYAWAFLVILIMIGALAYFGVLKPTKILPDRCTFGTEIGCIDYKITSGTTFDLRLKNNIGEPIIIDDIQISSESATSYTCAVQPNIGDTWNTNDIIDLPFTGCTPGPAGFVAGDKAKVFVAINFHLSRSSATYTRQVQGEVFSTVIEEIVPPPP